MKLRRRKKVKFTQKKAHRFRIVKRLFIFLIILAVPVFGVWAVLQFFFNEDYFVKDVVVEGNASVASVDIENKVEQKLSETEFFILPKKHALLLDTPAITEELKSDIPAIEDVQVKKVEETLQVTVEERVPDALWCHMKDTAFTCLFIDANGFAFKAAPESLTSAYVSYVTEGRAPEIGEYLLPQEQFSDLKRFYTLTATYLSSSVATVTISADEDITIKLRNGVEVYTIGSRLSLEILNDLQVVMEDLPEVFGSHVRHKLEYVDLRFEDKVLYKQKEVVEKSEN